MQIVFVKERFYDHEGTGDGGGGGRNGRYGSDRLMGSVRTFQFGKRAQ